MRTGLPAALLRGTPSAIRDDRFTRCPFPAATTHAPVALARSSNTAMEHRNRCTDLRHPELLATSLLKCPRQDCCETPSETKKIGKLSPLSSFIFLTLRGQSGHAVCASYTSGLPRSADIRRERRQRSSARSIIWRRKHRPGSGSRHDLVVNGGHPAPQAHPHGIGHTSNVARGMPSLPKVRLAGRCDWSTNWMISAFSEAGY